MERKAQITILTLLLAVTTAMAAQKISINSGWQFKKANEKAWKAVSLPHTWNAGDDTDDTPGYFRGEGIYRKLLHIEDYAAGKRVFLYFEGANQVSTIIVNGQTAGSHKGGYTRFAVDITPYVRVGETNVIEVRVDNSHNAAIPPLSADFTFYGGIYRDVYVVYEEPVHISMLDRGSSGLYISTPKVSETQAEVSLKVLLNNMNDMAETVSWQSTVTAPDGTTAAVLKGRSRLKAGTVNKPVTATAKILSPQLWSPDEPKLYSVRTVISDSKGKTLDECIDDFGLRWFSFDADKGFSLNGKPLKLIGTNRHQDYLGKGWALDDAYHLQDMRLIKQMGGNYLRVSHYPQDPAVLDECDRLGLLAAVEIPIVNAVSETSEFLSNCLTMQEEMIKQNFNHPSVIIWAYMNEVLLVPPYKSDNAKYQPYLDEVNRQARKIDSLTRRLDQGRYTMIPFHNAQKVYEDAHLFDVPQVIGWNIYSGWYSGSFSDMEKFLAEYHSKHPDKPTIISEYGADCDTRVHSDSPKRFDYSTEYTDLFQEHYLKAILRLPYIAGANLWNLNDFVSEARGNAVPHVNLKGIVTRDRKPKNTYWLYKAHLSKEPFVKIASADWTSRSGRVDSNGVALSEVKIYSNRPEMEVWLNGKSLGRHAVKEGFARITVPFVNGANNLSATSTDALHCTDAAVIRFNGVPDRLDESFTELSVLLGSTRSFTDPDSRVCWIPEKEYSPGSWGYVGGEAALLRNWAGTLPASDVPLLGTDLDPLYQTQRKGLTAFRADVPRGRYAVTLLWADLTQEKYENMANNLGNDAVHEDSDDSFSVEINGRKILNDIDIRKEAGRQTPFECKTEVDVAGGQTGIDIRLTPKRGQTLLNAVRIVKIK